MRARLKKVGKRYAWYLGDVRYGRESFKSPEEARRLKNKWEREADKRMMARQPKPRKKNNDFFGMSDFF